MKQLSFVPTQILVHGGSLSRKGKRKGARPLSEKRPLHLVLKAKSKILYPHRAAVEAEIREKGAHFGHRVYSVAVNHDHLHFIFRVSRRELYRGFIRALCGVLARRFGKGIWKLIPFSRVMNWGKDFEQGIAYLKQNREEASGARTFAPRRNWYTKWLE